MTEAPTDKLDPRRRRALYRASHRGTKEMDFLLGRYAEAMVPVMTNVALGDFERLLTLPDPELQVWLMAEVAPIDNDASGLVSAIRRFHGLAG